MNTKDLNEMIAHVLRVFADPFWKLPLAALAIAARAYDRTAVGWMLGIAFSMTLLDAFAALAVVWKNDQHFDAERMKSWFLKITGYCLTCLVIFLVCVAGALAAFEPATSGYDAAGYALVAFAVFVIAREVVSILQHIKGLGVLLPEWLVDFLQKRVADSPPMPTP